MALKGNAKKITKFNNFCLLTFPLVCKLIHSFQFKEEQNGNFLNFSFLDFLSNQTESKISQIRKLKVTKKFEVTFEVTSEQKQWVQAEVLTGKIGLEGNLIGRRRSAGVLGVSEEAAKETGYHCH